jgi:DEAD/DEAH box helicase domain-containing protein
MIYLDIETLDFFQDPHIAALPRARQLAAIRFGLAVTYDARSGAWNHWFADDLAGLWDHLAGAEQIVGWNIISFDIPVIGANLARSGRTIQTGDPPCCDLFDLIRRDTGRWYKLDVIAETNLGRQKLAHGQQAVEWLRAGDTESLRLAAEYCQEDVQIVMDLHAILEQGMPLRLPARRERRERHDVRWWLDGRTE